MQQKCRPTQVPLRGGASAFGGRAPTCVGRTYHHTHTVTPDTSSTSRGGSMRTFTADELRQFDGGKGRPALIAFRGLVYDVTGQAGWHDDSAPREGVLGRDVTARLELDGRDEFAFEHFPIVGVFIEPRDA
jgi:predicted heme/steroid binding protein